jgi:hypothetical protein
MESLKEEVRDFFKRNPEDKNWRHRVGHPDEKEIRRFVELLLVRENEINLPDPKRGTMDYYFHPWGPSDDMLKSLKTVVLPLLRAWAGCPNSVSKSSDDEKSA